MRSWLLQRENEQGWSFLVTKREKEAKSSIFQKIYNRWGTPDLDLFASRVFHQFPAYIVKTRPLQQRRGCFSDLMSSHTELCPPNVLSDSGNRSSNFDFNNTSVAAAVLVFITPLNGSEKPSSSTNDAQSIDRSKSGKSCISQKRNLTSPGIDSFWEKFSSEGLSKESSISLILSLFK